jgi:hypothetical protein
VVIPGRANDKPARRRTPAAIACPQMVGYDHAQDGQWDWLVLIGMESIGWAGASAWKCLGPLQTEDSTGHRGERISRHG